MQRDASGTPAACIWTVAGVHASCKASVIHWFYIGNTSANSAVFLGRGPTVIARAEVMFNITLTQMVTFPDSLFVEIPAILNKAGIQITCHGALMTRSTTVQIRSSGISCNQFSFTAETLTFHLRFSQWTPLGSSVTVGLTVSFVNRASSFDSR